MFIQPETIDESGFVLSFDQLKCWLHEANDNIVWYVC